MAHATHTHLRHFGLQGFQDSLGRAARAAGRVVTTIATHHPCMVELDRLNALSDADLQARGTTRIDQVRRIFGSRMGF